MLSSRRSSAQPFGWISALMFNGLMLIFAYVMSLLIIEHRNALGDEFVTSSEAVSATRAAMAELFTDLVPEGTDKRAFWAQKIDEELRAGDLVSARGFLLAAPNMLDKKDAGAVLAASNTERHGRLDDRLLSAATLFLPDDVRARYERATAPSAIETLTLDTPERDESALTEDTATLNPPSDADTGSVAEPDAAPLSGPVRSIREFDTDSSRNALFVLGSERDLAYQSAGWLRGDRTDVFALSLSGLGLAAQKGRFESTEITAAFLDGASLVKSARRAGRLQPTLSEVLETRLARALPPEALRAELQKAFGAGGSLLIQSDAILDAFAAATDETRLTPFMADVSRISQLADGRPNAAALTILETVSSLRDLKRAELIAFSGGDRAVTLSKYYGNDALDAAQTVLNWTMRLIILIILSVGLGTILLLIALATISRSFGSGRRFTSAYGYS